MERRKFILASGSGLLSSFGLISRQRRSIGVTYELSAKTSDINPSKADSVLLEFDRLEIKPLYLDESAPLDVTIQVSLENGRSTEKTASDISFNNGESIILDNDPNISTLLISGLSIDRSYLEGRVKIVVNNKNISAQSYSKKFSISDDSGVPSSEFDHLWWGPSISDISTFPDRSSSLDLQSDGNPQLSNINSNQAVNYDGDDHSTGSNLSLGPNDEWTIAAVYNVVDDGTNNRIFQTGSDSNSATGVGFGVRFDGNYGSKNYNIAHSGVDFINTGSPSTGREVAVASYDGSDVWLDANKTEIIGGQQLSSPNMSGSKTVIGSRGDGNVYTNGVIGAVGFESSFSNATRRDNLTDKLAESFDVSL